MDSAVVAGSLENQEVWEVWRILEFQKFQKVKEVLGVPEGMTPAIGQEIFDKNVNVRSQRFPPKINGLNPEKLKK